MSAPGTPQRCPNSPNSDQTHGVDWDGRTSVTKRGGRQYLIGTCTRCRQPVEAEKGIDDDWYATNYLIEEDPW